MTSLDTLKAGVATALAGGLTSLLAAVLVLLAQTSSWLAGGGDPPTLLALWVALGGAALALAVGVVNAVVRYLQVEGPALIARLITRIFGAAPTYTPPAEQPTHPTPDEAIAILRRGVTRPGETRPPGV